jgi:perosamine synthetase
LHLAVAALDLKPGDEVLISAMTNVATALAVYHNRCVAVPVDSEDTTWNLNLDLVESLITPRTRAIIPVHIYGHPVDMDRLEQIARKHDLWVIEDCAEAHGATVRGRKVGSFGDMGCYSFYANKIITTGEGGMVVTNDAALAERLRLLRNLAFTKPRFFHEVPGYNFRMTGFQGALGLSQLRRIEEILSQKRRVATAYNSELKSIRGLRLPVELQWARNVYWMYALVVDRDFGINRDELAKRLGAQGIETRTFFCGMHKQPFLRSQPGFRDIPCPVSDHLWESGMYLPSGTNLESSAISQIAGQIRAASSSR